VSTQTPASRKRSRIEELRAAHQAQYGPFEPGEVGAAATGAMPAPVPVTAERIAELFGVPVEAVRSGPELNRLAADVEEQGRPVTEAMREALDEYLAQNPDIVKAMTDAGLEVVINTDPIVLNPGGDIILSAPVNDLADDLVDDAIEPTDAAAEDALFKMWNRFTVDYRQYGADGTADRYKMEDLLALARFNGVDTSKLRKKLDVVRAIFA